jgi:hypothetical protein
MSIAHISVGQLSFGQMSFGQMLVGHIVFGQKNMEPFLQMLKLKKLMGGLLSA